MELFSEPLQDSLGNVLAGATVTVLNSAGMNAVLYSAEYHQKANPFTTDSLGTIEFRAANGLYTLRIYHPEYNGGQVKSVEKLMYDYRDGTFSEYGEINLTPVYASSSQFTTPGDRVQDLPEGRKLQIELSAGTVLSKVALAAYNSGANMTTVTIADLVLTNPIVSVKVNLYQPAPFPTFLPSLLMVGDTIVLDPAGDGYLLIGSGLEHNDVPFNVHDKLWFDPAQGILFIEGTVTADAGAIGGWAISADGISKGAITLDSTTESINVDVGNNYVHINSDGITGYDAVLGITFQLPTDGSAPTFSSGIIRETVYEMYTSGVIKTSDDPTTDGGLLANSARLAGYNNSGLKLMEFIYSGANQGDAYIGDYDSGNAGLKYDHSLAKLYFRGTLSADDIETGEINLAWDGGVIRSGQSAYAVGTGFWLGFDGDTPKFSIGDNSKFLRWDGTTLSYRGVLNADDLGEGTIDADNVNVVNLKAENIEAGGTITGNTLRTAASGKRFVVSHAIGEAEFYDSLENMLCSIGLRNTGADYAVGWFKVPAGTDAYAIRAENVGTNAAISAASTSGVAIGVFSNSGNGIYANSNTNTAIIGESNTTRGVEGIGVTYDFYASGGGANYGPFTGAHDALMNKNKASRAKPGDILVDVQLVNRRNMSNTIFEVDLSGQEKQTSVIGVLVGHADLAIDGPLPVGIIISKMDKIKTPELEATYNQLKARVVQQYSAVMVNALGEGQINVCAEGGDIQPGDFICTSSVPGKGMRQLDNGVPDTVLRSYTVAKAREGVSWGANDNSFKTIACTYHCG